VARHARQAAARGPAPVAIHDDGNVRRQSVGIDGAGKLPIPIPGTKGLQ
jgi:hypothetical protein